MSLLLLVANEKILDFDVHPKSFMLKCFDTSRVSNRVTSPAAIFRFKTFCRRRPIEAREKLHPETRLVKRWETTACEYFCINLLFFGLSQGLEQMGAC